MRQQPDDPQIANDDKLWRGLHPDQLIMQEAGTYRVSSSAFKTDGDGEISMSVARLTTQSIALMSAPSGHMAEIEAGLPRSFCMMEEKTSMMRCYTVALFEENGNPGHAHIHPPDGIKRSHYVKYAKKMALAARITPPYPSP
jgi:hypothetical protein